MKIKTKAFGEIEVKEKQKIYFAEGILGFEDIHHYFLIDNQEGGPFFWLQAENVPEIAFVVIEPNLVDVNYQLQTDPKDLKELNLEDKENMLLLSIVTINDDPKDITVNLLGPLVINKNTHQAKQVISTTDQYTVRHPLFNGKGG
ncbi:MAG: flagellar assembly protein FliW [Spirochaetes bacterium]|nr:flagellar assembly protein FliW [Spirochaetota bacterium]